MNRTPDLTGRRVGRLTVERRIERAGAHSALWRVVCDCGTRKTVRTTALTSGKTRSCGCLRRETSAANGRRNEGQARPKVRKKGAGGRPRKAPVVVVQKPAWAGAEQEACELARLWT